MGKRKNNRDLKRGEVRGDRHDDEFRREERNQITEVIGTKGKLNQTAFKKGNARAENHVVETRERKPRKPALPYLGVRAWANRRRPAVYSRVLDTIRDPAMGTLCVRLNPIQVLVILRFWFSPEHIAIFPDEYAFTCMAASFIISYFRIDKHLSLIEIRQQCYALRGDLEKMTECLYRFGKAFLVEGYVFRNSNVKKVDKYNPKNVIWLHRKPFNVFPQLASAFYLAYGFDRFRTEAEKEKQALVESSLNGTHGEFTGTDDVEQQNIIILDYLRSLPFQKAEDEFKSWMREEININITHILIYIDHNLCSDEHTQDIIDGYIGSFSNWLYSNLPVEWSDPRFESDVSNFLYRLRDRSTRNLVYGASQLNGSHGEWTESDDVKHGKHAEKTIRDMERIVIADRKRRGYSKLSPNKLREKAYDLLNTGHYDRDRQWTEVEQLYSLRIINEGLERGTIDLTSEMHRKNIKNSCVSDYVNILARNVFNENKANFRFTGEDPANAFSSLDTADECDDFSDIKTLPEQEMVDDKSPKPTLKRRKMPLDLAGQFDDDEKEDLSDADDMKVDNPDIVLDDLNFPRLPVKAESKPAKPVLRAAKDVNITIKTSKVTVVDQQPNVEAECVDPFNTPFGKSVVGDQPEHPINPTPKRLWPSCACSECSTHHTWDFRGHHGPLLPSQRTMVHDRWVAGNNRTNPELTTLPTWFFNPMHPVLTDDEKDIRDGILSSRAKARLIHERKAKLTNIARSCVDGYAPLTYAPLIPEEEEVTAESSIPVGFMPVDEIAQPGGSTISLVTSKYALNKHGLFILRDGVWQQTKSSGGYGKTFKGLNIKPIESQRVVGEYTPDGDNVYTVGGGDCVLLNPIQEINDFVTSSMPYQWFSKVRTLLDEWRTPGCVYNGHTVKLNKIFVNRQLLDILKRRITAGVSDLIYNSIFGIANDNCDNPEIALHTFLYFVEMKVISQKMAVGNVDAHSKFFKSRSLYTQPTSGVSVDMFSQTYDRTCQDSVIFTTRDECHQSLRQGFTNVERDYYTNCSDEYGSYDNPVCEHGGMLEPLSKKHADDMKKRGVLFKDPYIRFDYEESNIADSWQSVGGGFATSVKVINHHSTRQAEMAHSRVLFSRPDEIEQRLRATMYWREVMNVYNSLQYASDPTWCPTKAINDLVEHIQHQDPRYSGSDSILNNVTKVCSLEGPPLLQSFLQACIHDLYSSLHVLEEELRKLDNVKALEEYIESVGAKLPLRRGLVQKIKEMSTKEVASKVNVVQCKPHEFQKYKIKNGKPILKYARDVVSITNEDWIAAKPHLIAYVKKSLESEVRVSIFNRNNEWLVSASLQNHDQLLERDYRIPLSITATVKESYLNHRVGKNFFYRAVISDTSLDTLASVLERMTEAVVNVGDVYVITHGDDQLCLVKNDDPLKYKGRCGHVWIEGDINDNDGSHVDDFYRLDYLTFVRRGETPVHAFSQLANPLMLANPNKPSQYGVFRRVHGMQMCSGSVHTTYGNSKMSANVGLCLYTNDGDDYTTMATSVGMNVTSVYGSITDVTFLSKNFYYSPSEDGTILSIKCYTDLASLLRKVGRCTGDVLGKHNIPCDVRFDDHNEGVVKGWVHEPDSLIIKLMRRKYIHEKPKHRKFFGLHTTFSIRNPFNSYDKVMTDLDIGIIQHYYPDEYDRGESEYLQLLKLIDENDTYGVLIKSSFIDRIMNRRYGMIPVIQN